MNMPARTSRSTWIGVAFLYVYIAWGATYLAVHWALQSLPPFFIAAMRFLIAGPVLLGIVRLTDPRHFHFGNRREWRDALTVSALLLVGGNGAMIWAQQYVTSSVSALIFGILPLTMIVFEWLRPGGSAPTPRVMAGLALGFVGLCILIKPSPSAPDTRMELWGKFALVVAACSWSAGALASRHFSARGSAMLPMARQMICGGLVFLAGSLVHDDWPHLSLAHVSARSWMGLGYLILFGSLLGFTAYVWLMRVSTPARVSTISYVNLVVAVLLGWSLGGEPMAWHIILGAVVIISSVVLVLKKMPEQRLTEPAEVKA
jgi:drug/metabolite transporter (DMT)-like permease